MRLLSPEFENITSHWLTDPLTNTSDGKSESYATLEKKKVVYFRAMPKLAGEKTLPPIHATWSSLMGNDAMDQECIVVNIARFLAVPLTKHAFQTGSLHLGTN